MVLDPFRGIGNSCAQRFCAAGSGLLVRVSRILRWLPRLEIRMKECSKSIVRRMMTPNFTRKYFKGCGIDIGGRPDPLSLYLEFFPLMQSVRVWDLEDGDAQYMQSVDDEAFDFVHSSHCLEHIVDPLEALRNWVRIIRPGGYVILTVPDEDLYEQGVFPSSFNQDHKHTFTIKKGKSWSSRSINVTDMLCDLGETVRIEKIELLDGTYRYELPRFDQSLTPVAESGIEVVLRKPEREELIDGGRIRRGAQPERELRRHYNQYRDDIRNMKANNASQPPFENDAELGGSA